MANNRLLSQITELHQVIAKLKGENRRLESRAKASRAYARTVEQSTYFPHSNGQRDLKPSVTSETSLRPSAAPLLSSSSSLPVLSLTAGIMSRGGLPHLDSRRPTSSGMFSRTIMPQTDSLNSGGSALSSADNGPNGNAKIDELERENLYLSNRVAELEDALKSKPSEAATLAAHAATATAYLEEREKRIVDAVTQKLNILTDDLEGLKKKRSRIALKEKIMIEIEAGRVGTRHNPVPALSHKINSLEVRVNFLNEVKELISKLTSQLQQARSSANAKDRDFRRQLEEKKSVIMNQGLRIRHYEKDSAKREAQNTQNEANLSLVLDNIMRGDGNTRADVDAKLILKNRIDTPSGSLVLLPLSQGGTPIGETSAKEVGLDSASFKNEDLSQSVGTGIREKPSSFASQNIDQQSTMQPTPSMLEQSLRHVGGLPRMGPALTNPSPHLVPPHQLPRGRAGGDPRDNQASRGSEAQRISLIVNKQGKLGRAARPMVYQISSGQKDMLTGQILWKNIGIFNRMDAIEMFAGKGRHIYRQ